MDQLLENMIESLTCYNCRAIPGKNKDKRYSCHKNSHQLCETCKSKCKCESSVMETPNLIVEKLLQYLPIYCQNYRRECRQIFHEVKDLDEHEKTCNFGILYCRNKIRKCQQNFLEIEELEDHQKKCDYRLIICPSNRCRENNGAYATVTFKYWDKHCLDKRHKRTESHQDCYDMFILPNDNSLLFKQPMRIFLRLPIYLENIIFPVMKYSTLFEFFKLPNNVELCLIAEVVSDIVKIWMCINGLPSEAKRYSYNISYKGYGPEDEELIDYQVLTLEENPLDIITNKPVFMVGLDVVKRNNKKNKVGFVITIFDLEKPKKTRWQKLKKKFTD